ncbi:MAG TPA: iron-sulfur cluster assembly accessory protein [Metalysinibacillus jejuensis]|uniref:Iron-sulfur cluster assembly accessory protein n=1 Tax=Metalysinibacillus jejuensis TaxID=914327 RepID=A0A921NDE9_9BACL|nr:iron-sulfur cluster assembly accessory protein [Metalysinibacillus jejuensis]HJH11473.1 iron-sulfur cluster assembly accessory protein [Metalysinibacillus jejuensis]
MTITKQVIDITESASFRIKEMMEYNEEQGAFLRVSVNGGGCSGLSYGMNFDREQRDTDLVDEQFGLSIVIDKEDAAILEGTRIDYKQSLMGGGFTIDNPNAIASCGCGTSFRAEKREGTPEVCE